MYPTVTVHSKQYPCTSIMADPYLCDPLGVVDSTTGIEAIKAYQNDIGQMTVPEGLFLIDANLTIPIGMTFDMKAGSGFEISSGKLLAVQNMTAFSCGYGRIFYGSGGKVGVPNGSVLRTSWFNGLANLVAMLYDSPKVTVILDMDETITSNLTVPANIKVSSPFGITITVDDGVTLTFLGPVDLANPPTIINIGGGTVIYAGTAAFYIYPQMYGAIADGETDDTAAVNQCFIAGASLNVPVYIPSGTYLCGNLLYGSNADDAESTGPPKIYGNGPASIFKAKPGTSGVFFKATNLAKKRFESFVIDANDQSGITTAFDTSYFESSVLGNSYEAVSIRGYYDTGWVADNNNNSDFKNCYVTNPTNSADQLAFSCSATGGQIVAKDMYFDGRLFIEALTARLDTCYFVGIWAAGTTTVLDNCRIESNNTFGAAIRGDCNSVVILGGHITTQSGHNHFAGQFNAGAVIIGTKFTGAGGENVLGAGLAGAVDTPTFRFENCFMTGGVTFNYESCPAGIRVVASCVNLNNGSIVSTDESVSIGYTFQAFTSNGTYTKGGAKKVVVQCYGGGGGGGSYADTDYYGGGGGGGGYAIQIFNADDLAGSVGVEVGAGGAGAVGFGNSGSAGGTTNFGSLVYANGGAGGTSGNFGGAGGGASGGYLMLGGEDGESALPPASGRGGAGAGPMGGGSSYGVGKNYGAGGAGGVATGYDGAGGLCFVESYS